MTLSMLLKSCATAASQASDRLHLLRLRELLLQADAIGLRRLFDR
jgi:hypothetical protein